MRGRKKIWVEWLNSTLSFPQFHKCSLSLNSVPFPLPTRLPDCTSPAPAALLTWATDLPCWRKGKENMLQKISSIFWSGFSPQEYPVSKQNLRPGFMLSVIALMKRFASYSRTSHDLHILTSRLCSLSYMTRSFHPAPKPSEILWNGCYLCNPYKFF